MSYIARKRAAMKSATKAGKLNFIGFNALPQDTDEELFAELVVKMDELQAKKAYTTFALLSKALGMPKYDPGQTGIIIGLVTEACGKEFTALITDVAGRQSPKVAEDHRKVLEDWGYTQFPGVSKAKKKTASVEMI